MYRIIYFAGFLIRQYALPNPFIPFGNNAELINLIVGGILIPVSYVMVGLIYSRGSNPALGSILFTILYVINTGVTYLVCLVYPMMWLICLIVIGYFLIYLLVAYRIGEIQ